MAKGYEEIPFSALQGETILTVNVAEDEHQVDFHCLSGTVFSMFHVQDCCEDVHIEEVYGEWEDVTGSPVLEAEKTSNIDDHSNGYDHITWTFYRIRTMKGTVTIRWCGSSNGYYSEDVEFYQKK